MAQERMFHITRIIAFILFIHATSVAAISCFQCNSYFDPDCANIQPNDTSSPHYKPCYQDDEETIGKEIFCRKVVQTIYDRDGLVRVIRKCGWILQKRECNVFTTPGHEDISCQCFHDGCNVGPKTQIDTSLIIFLCLLPLAYIIQ